MGQSFEKGRRYGWGCARCVAEFEGQGALGSALGAAGPGGVGLRPPGRPGLRPGPTGAATPAALFDEGGEPGAGFSIIRRPLACTIQWLGSALLGLASLLPTCLWEPWPTVSWLPSFCNKTGELGHKYVAVPML